MRGDDLQRAVIDSAGRAVAGRALSVVRDQVGGTMAGARREIDVIVAGTAGRRGRRAAEVARLRSVGVAHVVAGGAETLSRTRYGGVVTARIALWKRDTGVIADRIPIAEDVVVRQGHGRTRDERLTP